MYYIRYLVSLLIASSITLVEPVYAEENIAINQLPKTVADALKKQFPGAELREAERNEKQGQLIYEVDISVDGTKKEVEVTPEGKIVKEGTGD